MNFRVLACIVALFSLTSAGCKTPQSKNMSDIKFNGYDNQRYKMRFENTFIAPADTPESKVLDEAYGSLRFLFGAFQWHKEFVSYKGIPHNKPSVKITKKDLVEENGVQVLKVTYVFDDEVVFNKSLNKTAIEFWMPKDRQAIYKMGEVEGKFPCTDPTYTTAGDFWYFWNPENPGCPAKFKEGLNRVKATFAAIPNTLNKYPLYGKLGSNKTRLVYIAHGADKKLVADDPGMKAYSGTLIELARLGFVEKEVLADTEEEKHLVYSANQKNYTVEVHVGLFKSGSPQFTVYGRQGLSTADVFIYNGHSGLGGFLPPSRFAPLTLPKKYQIFMFNGCSTFAYYNQNYFDKKKEVTGRPGSESLEIITTGLEAWFGVQPYATSSLINDLLVTKSHLKWEQIVMNLYNQTSKYTYGENNQWKMDPKQYSAHYQVNGDEDNPSDLATALLGGDAP